MPIFSKSATIENIIADGDLHAAFDRWLALIQHIHGIEAEINHLQAQLNTIEREANRDQIDSNERLQQSNRVRHAFLFQLENFKRDLPEFMDTSQPVSLLLGVKDQMLVVKEVMEQRLRRYYDIIEQIRDGNSAIVFKLKDIFTQRFFICKVLKVPTLTDKMRIEISQVAALKHRNIIKLLGESLDQFPFFIITEYVNGAVLGDALQITGPRPISQALDWLCQLSDVLDYLRQKRINHSNIRPSKIFVDEEQQLMISPFDIIKSGMDERTLIRFREDCQYMSPELLDGDSETFDHYQSCASDQFSLGLIAYKILTGTDLFQGDSISSIIERRLEFMNNPAFRASRLELIEEPEIYAILERLLDPNPQKRFSDLHEVYNTLHAYGFQNKSKGSAIRNSYRRCLAANQHFLHDFYTALLPKLPEKIQKQFSNLDRQQTMLQMAFDILIDLDTKEHLFIKLLGHGPHQAFAAPLYQQFLDVLIDLAIINDREMTQSLQQEWIDLKNRAMKIVHKISPVATND